MMLVKAKAKIIHKFTTELQGLEIFKDDEDAHNAFFRVLNVSDIAILGKDEKSYRECFLVALSLTVCALEKTRGSIYSEEGDNTQTEALEVLTKFLRQIYGIGMAQLLQESLTKSPEEKL